MKFTPLVGRLEEKKILENALQSPKAEMVSIIGRRRVGKTFLVKSVYSDKIDFEITGIQHATRQEQLRNFMLQISKYSGGSFPLTEPKDWLGAFYLLSKFLELKRKSGKMIIFLDELPWLATHKSGFLKGLGWFWNSWATDRHIVVVICGSAASWMIKNVVHNKGGLHNRITKRINLRPFNLAETEHFFKTKKLNFDRYQILHCYMAMGGVPHYLDEIEPGKSAAQNIDAICFSENGLLWDEFPKLYASLFENSEAHVRVIRALAGKHKGLTRKEIVENSRLPEGGGASTVIEELLHSGFISVYQPFGKKKKDSLYRLTDEYSLFYLQFMENNRQEGPGVWQQLSKTQAYAAWAGYAFENICLKHIPQIKKALGISGVYSTYSSFLKKGSDEEEGIQFDLLIDRNDHVINICEIKFYAAEFTIDKSMAMNYRNKIATFRETTHTRKQVFLTMITTFGVKNNQHSSGLVDAELTMDDLFGG
ncbi:MAG: ATP-binding protein [Saprospiraceae bacterium]|nr:ATP-binding protein [Saprospiraceae bacterium]